MYYSTNNSVIDISSDVTVSTTRAPVVVVKGRMQCFLDNELKSTAVPALAVRF